MALEQAPQQPNRQADPRDGGEGVTVVELAV